MDELKNCAGFWERFTAMIIDIFLFFVIASPLIIYSFLYTEFEDINIIVFMFLVLYFIYSIFMESSKKQATLGKMALGLIVTDMNKEKISLDKATSRNLTKIFSGLIFFIGFLVQPFTKNKQALHDKMSKCLVLRTIEKPKTKLIILVIGLLLISSLIVICANIFVSVNKFGNVVTRSKIANVKLNMQLLKIANDTYSKNWNGFYADNSKILIQESKNLNLSEKLVNPYTTEIYAISDYKEYKIAQDLKFYKGQVLYNPIFDKNSKVTKYIIYGLDKQGQFIKDEDNIYYLTNQ